MTSPRMQHAGKASAAVLIAASAMTAQYEGLYTHAYKDSVGVTTICYGETNADIPVHMGDVKTVAECKALLPKSLAKYDAQLTACLNHDIPDYMHITYISFTYNVGPGAFCKGSVARLFNQGDLRGSCNAMRLYNKGGGRVIKGLDNRRRGEQAACLKGITQGSIPAGTVVVVKPLENLPTPDPVNDQVKVPLPTPKPIVHVQPKVIVNTPAPVVAPKPWYSRFYGYLKGKI